MEVQKGEWIRAAMRIVEDFFSNREMEQSHYCESGTEWITPYAGEEGGRTDSYRRLLSDGMKRVIHKGYRIVMRTGRAVLLTGSCHAVSAGASGRVREDYIHVTLALRADEDGEIRLKLIHISQADDMGRKLCLRDIKERIFYIGEREILYLEAMHNHVIWHCKSADIETVGSLKEKEGTLPESFVRIQRGFIVNTEHIRRIDRCFAEMDNGDRIPIPVKRFCEVRDGLLKRQAGKGVSVM